MISSKVLPAFYVLDLQGDAANLESFLGSKHNICRVTVHSLDFSGDVLAAVAGQDALNFFAGKFSRAEEKRDFNPEFFPNLVATEHVEDDKATKIDEENITRKFDEWGDFVVARTTIEDTDFKAIMKVAVNPQQYLLEKSLEKLEYTAHLHGQRTDTGSAIVH
jgi:hypothetical protein